MANHRKQTREVLKKELYARREYYANKWSNNAKSLTQNGDYLWMCGFISEHRNVLEIGCGDGSSTLELFKNGHKIISIEENKSCLNMAYDKLKAAGVNVSIVEREVLDADNTEPNLYTLRYGMINTPIETYDVVLIEGDIQNDPNLINWLKSLNPFDAIVCWLIGSHSFRSHNNYIFSNKIETPLHYRIKLQNLVYEIADVILCNGGILHIVDRADTPKDDQMRNDYIDSHKDQASVTSLIVEALDYRDYKEAEDGIKMGISSISDKDTSGFNPAFISTIARKS